MLLRNISVGAVAILVLGATGSAAAPAPVQHPLTVCEFVRNVKTLNGHIVSIRGTVVDMGSTVSRIIGDCNGLNNPQAKEVRVRIFFPDENFMRKEAPKGFRWDPASFQRVGRMLEKAKTKSKSADRFIATIEGVGYSSPPASPSTKPTERPVRPLEGTYNASIVIGAIRDVKVVGQ